MSWVLFVQIVALMLIASILTASTAGAINRGRGKS